MINKRELYKMMLKMGIILLIATYLSGAIAIIKLQEEPVAMWYILVTSTLWNVLGGRLTSSAIKRLRQEKEETR